MNALYERNFKMYQKVKAAEIYPFLEVYISKKEREINEIEQLVDRYEKKRMIEEKTYQSLSPIRRLLTGKKPDHHLAVEYIHYVKKPMEKLRRLRSDLQIAKEMLNAKPNEIIVLPDDLEI